MVITYWDMAAAMVNNGAIDAQMFNDANGEHIFVYSKIEPVLKDLRAKRSTLTFSGIWKRSSNGYPTIEEKITALRARDCKDGRNLAATGRYCSGALR